MCISCELFREGCLRLPLGRHVTSDGGCITSKAAHDITARHDTYTVAIQAPTSFPKHPLPRKTYFYDKSDPRFLPIQHCRSSTSFLSNPRLPNLTSPRDRAHVSISIFVPCVFPTVHPSTRPRPAHPPRNPSNRTPHWPQTCHRHALPVDDIASGTVRRWLAIPAPTSDAGDSDAPMR